MVWQEDAMARNPRPEPPTPGGERPTPAGAEQSEESRRILDQTARDSHTLFGGALRGMFRTPSAADDRAPGDPVERWGKIVGRTLGYGLALFLLFNLLSGWWM